MNIRPKIDLNLTILIVLLVITIIVIFFVGGWNLFTDGLAETVDLVQTVWLRLLIGIILGGLIQVIVPKSTISKWLGPSSGLKGILIGSYIGIIIPGGPYVHLPIIASVYKAGAGVGPVIALLAGRALLGLQVLLVWQIPFLGTSIPLARYITCLLMPPLIGLFGQYIYNLFDKMNKSNE